jgi:hypothetical protein
MALACSTRRSASEWSSAYVVSTISRIHFEAGSLARRDDQKKRVRNVDGVIWGVTGRRP